MKETKIVITLDEFGNPIVDRFNISILDSITLLDLVRAQLRIEGSRNEEESNSNYPLQHIYPY